MEEGLWEWGLVEGDVEGDVEGCEGKIFFVLVSYYF